MARCCHTATSERGRGWVGYLPSDYNARSEASEHAFARVTIHRQNPQPEIQIGCSHTKITYFTQTLSNESTQNRY